ncbi:MAG: hypothetical protein Q4A82_07870 [Corynebacterium sp.]|nr:hypothetical protein [Corynebacterium sp.]
MATIQFDCLMPACDVTDLLHRFEQLSALVVRDGKAETAHVTHDNHPTVWAEIETKLRQTYVEEHQAIFDQAAENPEVLTENGVHPVADMAMHRYSVTVQEVTGSINQLAMLYARLLTPPVKLPPVAVVVCSESEFELPAYYPWSVEVYA